VTVGRPLLFDTQAVVLWSAGQVPEPVRRRVLDGAVVYVSIVSAWEFLLKGPKGFGMSYDQFLATVTSLEAELLGIDREHLQTLRNLPFPGRHRDPFDRMIISQAIRNNLILVGGDTQFAAYQKHRALQILWKR
jgi:PIN domain nuclease of toxin-antitoxin system